MYGSSCLPAADTAPLNKEYNKVSNKIAKPTAFYPPLPANGTFFPLQSD
jgi:hypothetical protein